MILFSVDVTGMFNQTADSPFQEEPNWNNEEAVMWALELLPVRLPESMFIPFVKANSEPSWLRV